MELLKLIWFPILITDSSELIREALLLFSSYFHICYPDTTKEKLKLLFMSKEIKKENLDTYWSKDSEGIYDLAQLSFTSTKFTNIIVPLFLPSFNHTNELNKIREGLILESNLAIQSAIDKRIKKEKTLLGPKLAHKYIFPWNLMPGLFEKFTTFCILNSDLYYKYHFKNFVLAYNESRTLG